MEIDDERLDALREISHIGAGNASKSLSKITGKHIDVEFPEIDKCEVKDVPGVFGDKDDLVTTVSMEMHTEVTNENREDNLGRMALVLCHDSAKNLSQLMTGEENDEDRLTDMERSAIQEAGNILAGNFLEATSQVISFGMYEGLPYVHTDMLGSSMEGMILDMVEENDEVIVFNTQFSADDNIEAYFIVLFNKRGYELILNKIDANIEL